MMIRSIRWSKWVTMAMLACILFAEPNRIWAQEEPGAPSDQAKLVDVAMIWNRAPHNAFTDLVRWRDRWYCAFREGQGHAGDRGKLRVIQRQEDGTWESVALLEMEKFDLRDAALSISPDDRLLVLGGAQHVVDGRRETGTWVAFSEDGQNFSRPRLVIQPGRWLWRVTWHDGVAWGVDYGTPTGADHSSLLKTKNGIDYVTVVPEFLKVGGRPTEARVRFGNDGTAWCLHRRDASPNTAYLGSARPPYQEWTWKDLGVRIGGPNLVQLPDRRWVGCGRLYDGRTRTEVFFIDPQAGRIQPLLTLPSGGDTSYPGMVWHEAQLWISYYASHEGRTSIYLARVEFPQASNKSDSDAPGGQR